MSPDQPVSDAVDAACERVREDIRLWEEARAGMRTLATQYEDMDLIITAVRAGQDATLDLNAIKTQVDGDSCTCDCCALVRAFMVLDTVPSERERESVVDEIGEERALAALLAAGVCFVSGSDYLSPWSGEPEKTCAVLVNCNDLFFWGYADAESLPRSEIVNLYRAWKSDKCGVDRWCCLHRKLRPQLSVVAHMKEAGCWDKELEALPSPSKS